MSSTTNTDSTGIMFVGYKFHIDNGILTFDEELENLNDFKENEMVKVMRNDKGQWQLVSERIHGDQPFYYNASLRQNKS